MTTERTQPRRDSGWQAWLVPAGLWLLLWGGLNASYSVLNEWSFIRFIDMARFFLPMVSGGMALLWLFRIPAVPWPAQSPLRLLTFYGVTGLMTSVVLSPEPIVAVCWALAYLAVLVVLRLWLAWFQSDAERGVRRMIQLNWVLTAVIGIALIVIAAWVLLPLGRVTLRELTGPIPWVLGMPMVRQTGFGRYAGILAIVALARTLGHSGSRRWVWRALLLAAVAVVVLSQSRVAFIGLSVSVLLVLFLPRSFKVFSALGV